MEKPTVDVVSLLLEIQNADVNYIAHIARVGKHAPGAEHTRAFLEAFRTYVAKLSELAGDATVEVSVCDSCGSPDVQTAGWSDVNTNYPQDGIDNYGYYCPVCETNVDIREVKVRVCERLACLASGGCGG